MALNSTALNQALSQILEQSGLRKDMTLKANGFFGPLPAANGMTATELSTTVNFDGQERLIPLLVPTLDRSEVQYLTGGGKPSGPKDPIVQKAVSFARQRLSQGLSPFATNQEIPYGIKLP